MVFCFGNHFLFKSILAGSVLKCDLLHFKDDPVITESNPDRLPVVWLWQNGSNFFKVPTLTAHNFGAISSTETTVLLLKDLNLIDLHSINLTLIRVGSLIDLWDGGGGKGRNQDIAFFGLYSPLFDPNH